MYTFVLQNTKSDQYITRIYTRPMRSLIFLAPGQYKNGWPVMYPDPGLQKQLYYF